MLLAKLTALVGLALFVGGALGVVGTYAQAVSAVLLLVAAGIGAVVLEGRDLEHVAGLARAEDQIESPVIEPAQPTPAFGEAFRPAA
jgi:hypothetical protein